MNLIKFVLNFIETSLCPLFWYYIKAFLFTFSKLQVLRLYLIYFLSYWNMVATYHTKNVKCNSLGLSLATVPLPPKWNFVHCDFQILHYISHKMKYVSPLRVAALECNIMLRTLPRKITLNFPDNASNMTYSHFFSSLVQV